MCSSNKDSVFALVNELIQYYAKTNVQSPDLYEEAHIELQKFKFYLMEILISHRKEPCKENESFSYVSTSDKVLGLCCSLAAYGKTNLAQSIDSCFSNLSENDNLTPGSTLDSFLTFLLCLSTCQDCDYLRPPASFFFNASVRSSECKTQLTNAASLLPFPEFPEELFSGSYLEQFETRDETLPAWTLFNARRRYIPLPSNCDSYSSNIRCFATDLIPPLNAHVIKHHSLTTHKYHQRRSSIQNTCSSLNKPLKRSTSLPWISCQRSVSGSVEARQWSGGAANWPSADYAPGDDDAQLPQTLQCLGAGVNVTGRPMSPSVQLRVPELPDSQTLGPVIVFPSQHFAALVYKPATSEEWGSDEGYASSHGSSDDHDSQSWRRLRPRHLRPDNAVLQRHVQRTAMIPWEEVAQQITTDHARLPYSAQSSMTRRGCAMKAFDTALPLLLEAGPQATHMVWYKLHSHWAYLTDSRLSSLPVLSVLPPATLCQNIIFAAVGVPSDTFRYDSLSGRFSVRPGTCVEGITPEAVEPILHKYALTATRVHRLEMLCEAVKGSMSCAVRNAFIIRLRSLLHSLRGEVFTLLGAVHLLQLDLNLEPHVTKVEHLAEVCGVQVLDNGHAEPQHPLLLPVGSKSASEALSSPSDNISILPSSGMGLVGELLQRLTLSSCRESAQLLLVLLKSAMIPFLFSLQQWVFSGSPSASVVNVDEAALSSKDPELWSCAFRACDEEVPVLLRPLTTAVLQTGAAVALLRLCDPQHPLALQHPLAPVLTVCSTTYQLSRVEAQCVEYKAAVEALLQEREKQLMEKQQRQAVLRVELYRRLLQETRRLQDERQREACLEHSRRVAREQEVLEEMREAVRVSRAARCLLRKQAEQREEKLEQQHLLQQQCRNVQQQQLKNALQNYYEQIAIITDSRASADLRRLLHQQAKEFTNEKMKECNEFIENEIVDPMEFAADVNELGPLERFNEQQPVSVNMTSDFAGTTPEDGGIHPSLLDTPSPHLVNYRKNLTVNDVFCFGHTSDCVADQFTNSGSSSNDVPDGKYKKGCFVTWKQLIRDRMFSNIVIEEEEKPLDAVTVKRVCRPDLMNNLFGTEGNETELSIPRAARLIGNEALNNKKRMMQDEFGIAIASDVYEHNVKNVASPKRLVGSTALEYKRKVLEVEFDMKMTDTVDNLLSNGQKLHKCLNSEDSVITEDNRNAEVNANLGSTLITEDSSINDSIAISGSSQRGNDILDEGTAIDPNGNDTYTLAVQDNKPVKCSTLTKLDTSRACNSNNNDNINNNNNDNNNTNSSVHVETDRESTTMEVNKESNSRILEVSVAGNISVLTVNEGSVEENSCEAHQNSGVERYSEAVESCSEAEIRLREQRLLFIDFLNDPEPLEDIFGTALRGCPSRGATRDKVCSSRTRQPVKQVTTPLPLMPVSSKPSFFKKEIQSRTLLLNKNSFADGNSIMDEDNNGKHIYKTGVTEVAVHSLGTKDDPTLTLLIPEDDTLNNKMRAIESSLASERAMYDEKKVLEENPDFETESDLPPCVSAVPMFMLRALTSVVHAQQAVCGKALVQTLRHRHQLHHHLSALRDWLLLQDAAFANTLVAVLMEHHYSGKFPSTVLTPMVLNAALSSALEEAMLGRSDFAQYLSFVLPDRPVQPPAFVHSDVIVSMVRLQYRPPWPCRLILSPVLLASLFPLTSLLLSVAAARHTTQRTFNLTRQQGRSLGAALTSSAQYHAVCLWRHLITHCVEVLHCYLTQQVVTVCGVSHTDINDSDPMVGKAMSLEQLADNLQSSVAALTRRCFLTNKAAPVQDIIKEIITLVHLYHDQLCAHSWTPQTGSISARGHYTHRNFSVLQQTYEMFTAKATFLCRLLERVQELGYVQHVEQLLTTLDYTRFYH